MSHSAGLSRRRALRPAEGGLYGRCRPDPVPTVFGYHEVFHALVVLAGLIFYVAGARVAITA